MKGILLKKIKKQQQKPHKNLLDCNLHKCQDHESQEKTEKLF